MAERLGSDRDDRLRRVESVTETALAHLDYEDLLVELLDRVRDLLGVDTAAILMLNRSGRQLVPVAARGIEEEVRRGIRIPVGKGFAGSIVAERRPRVLDRVDSTTVANPVLWETGIQTMLGVPMLVEGSVTGVLHVGRLTRHHFDDEDMELLQLVADRVALAAQAQLSRADRAAASALQRSLLPPELPIVEGLELAARYVPGTGGVSGDWYDVLDLPSGPKAVVIGDVAGRGLPAAVVMGRMRSMLRACALEFDDPAQVLTKLDQVAHQFEPDILATVLYALIDPSHERVRISSAGHPPPLLVHPDQPATVVDVAGDVPIGADAGLERRTVEVALPTGALLCLYTDGLVERRGQSVDVGIDQLVGALAAGTAESVCTDLMARFVGAEPTHDDIALMVVRRRLDES